MSLKKRLLLVIYSSAIFTILLVIFFFNAAYQSTRTVVIDDKSHEIVKNIFEMNLLFDQYLINRSDDIKNQWFLKNHALEDFLDRSQSFFKGEEKIKVFNELRIMNSDARKNFEVMNMDLLSTTLRSMIERSLVLQGSSADDLAAAIRFSILSVGFCIFFLLFIGIINLLTIYRNIISPIEKLHMGTHNIAGGDWKYKVDIGISGKDNEITHLVDSFNKMVAKLAEFRDTMEKKIAEKTGDLAGKIADLEASRLAMLNLAEDLRFKNNELSGMMSRAFETTEKLQKIRDNFEAQKEKDEAILASIGDGVVACDKEGTIILFNDAAEKLTGFSFEEADGRHYNEVLNFILEDTDKKAEDFIKKAIVMGLETTIQDHSMIRTKSGEEISVDQKASPIKNSNGDVFGCAVIFRDITKERAVDRMKTEFVSIASHQLRTPLTAIKLFTEMIKNEDSGKLNDMQKIYVGDLYESTNRMIRLVNDLLNVSRLESGRLKIEPVSVSYVDFIQGIIDDVSPLAKDRGCDIVFSKPEEKLPDVMIDRVLLGQVINNIITNAVKYSPAGKCDVIVELEKQNGDYLVSIKDIGFGISEKDRSEIFKKFFRSGTAMKKDPDGSGLGMYVAKMILDASGGKIWFESEENKGATFYVKIPQSGMMKKEGEKGLEV